MAYFAGMRIGFVRSRVSKKGIFFSDTSAGTVDQSMFIFHRSKGRKNQLSYLYGSGHPIGSSLIEKYASQRADDSSWQTLEHMAEVERVV
jgi:hypothetical protein